MNETTPRFVRCIKSNADKVADRFRFPHGAASAQVRWSHGGARVRRAGFPNRLAFLDFLRSYSSLIRPMRILAPFVLARVLALMRKEDGEGNLQQF